MLTVDGGDLDRIVRDLRTYPGRKVVVKSLRRGLRAPLPQARAAVRASALATLPARGGLGAWVAKARIGAQVRVTATTVTVTVRAGRSSTTGKRSDIRAIDRGRVRAKAWGRPRWHRQAVPAGFFSDTITDDMAPVWRAAADRAAAQAAEAICGRA